ncbi:MAG: methyltransferase domain-containing protein [Porticoccaceae bacterium]
MFDLKFLKNTSNHEYLDLKRKAEELAAEVQQLKAQNKKLSSILNKQTEVENQWKALPKRHNRLGDIIADLLKKSGLSQGKVLEIGGRENPYKDSIFKDFDYYCLDIEATGEDVIIGDITNCPNISSDEFDFIFSVDVFEHIDAPWKAASEISRILRPGGLTYHSTLFSWRYHPCPIDYWRFSPDALAFLFSELEQQFAYFDTVERRRNIVGKGKYQLEQDSFGGWRENWRVHYAGQKSR